MVKHGDLGPYHCSHPGTCKSEAEISIFAFMFMLLKKSLFSLLVFLGVKITPGSLVTRWFGFSRINGQALCESELPVKSASRK